MVGGSGDIERFGQIFPCCFGRRRLAKIRGATRTIHVFDFPRHTVFRAFPSTKHCSRELIRALLVPSLAAEGPGSKLPNV